jgi:hypothetical protein
VAETGICFNPLHARIRHVKRRAGCQNGRGQERNILWTRSLLSLEFHARRRKSCHRCFGHRQRHRESCPLRSVWPAGSWSKLGVRFIHYVIHGIEEFAHVVRCRRRKQYKGTFHPRQRSRAMLTIRQSECKTPTEIKEATAHRLYGSSDIVAYKIIEEIKLPREAACIDSKQDL